MSRKLGQKQIDEFKTAFEEQIRTIYRSHLEKKLNGSTELDFDGDEIDIVQGNLLSSISDNLSQRDIQRLKRIQNALTKIKDGTFGSCEECEGQIPKARLLARPEAELCIACAEKAEQEAKFFARK